MEAKFKVRSGPPMVPLIIPLQEGTSLFLGRGSACDILVDDRRLAEMHCQVIEVDGRYFLWDLHTQSGTYVNGVRITRQELQSGDVVELGSTEMQFQRVDEGKTTRRERKQKPRDPNVGRTVADYLIQDPLGHGAISVVYKARQISRDRIVALKVLSPRLSRDPASRERFLKGARTAALLRHPHIVPIIAAGHLGEFYYLTMDLVPGETVKEVMARVGVGGSLLPSKAFMVARQMADALVYLRQEGMVHRDIKPSNILIEPSGHAQLCDLELAKKIDEIGQDEDDARPAGYLGTLPYMSLEQVLDPETVDHRSDIYALGTTMYGMLTGHPPFKGESRTEIVDRISAGDFPHPSTLSLPVPPALWDVILRAMSIYPEDRYQTPEELREALVKVGQANGWEKS